MVDKPTEYGYGGPPGPAAIKAWKGKVRQKSVMIAWLKVGKNYVSYHIMGVYMNPKLLGAVSKELKTRMQGMACFNFKKIDEPLFKELDRITVASFTDLKKSGFIS